MGSFRPVAGNAHLHACYNFTESLAETATKSLRHSCGSELTRQGISLIPVLTQTFDNVGAEAFLTSLHVAMQMGPYLQLSRTVWRMASEDSARTEQSFLLIVRTRRIVTARTQ